VGANAVVVKNVPDNCVVVGIPAYIIKRDGVKVKEELV
jgi:serine O-acetyltransferase